MLADPNQPRPRRIRRGLIAGILSILCIGLGQIYNGQIRKGLSLFALALSFMVLAFALGLPRSFPGLVVYLGTDLSLLAFAIAEAVRTQLRRTGPPPSRGWQTYPAAGAILAAGVAVYVGLLPGGFPLTIRAYNIPSSTMAPTIEAGDRVMVDMHYYRRHTPERGDLVAIVSPPFGELTVKRIAAVAGDLIELNPQFHPGDPQFVEHYLGPAAENLGGHSKTVRAAGEAVVPRGDVFVMGDNRTHSYDSRYYGFLGEDRIKGRPLYIYWSRSVARVGRKLR